MVSLDEYESVGTLSIAEYVNGDNVIYIDSFGVEYTSKEIEQFIGNKNIVT